MSTTSTPSGGVIPPGGVAEIVVELRGISKRFGAQVAAQDVSFDLRAGEVHSLVGENGAGKSTVIKILSGLYRQDAGEVLVRGERVALSTPSDSSAAGIGVIQQQPALIDAMSVSENVTLGAAYPVTRGVISWRRQHRRCRELLLQVGLDVDPSTPLRHLAVADKQLVAIARVLHEEHHTIVLDEVTASLTAQEVRRLFDLIRSLAARGVAFLYVSHRLEEVLELSDRVTVMRNGRHVATREREGLTEEMLTRLIIGKDRNARSIAPPALDASAPVRLTAEGLTAGLVRDVSLSVRAGEILGLAGLAGSGRTEVLECLFGMRRLEAGTMTVEGREFRPKAPVDAVARGLALVTEDRKRDGFIEDAPVWQTITLPWVREFARAGVLNLRSERRRAAQVSAQFDVRAASISSPMRELSGGNQQKAILARWLSHPLKVLLLDEPTHGVDIGAKEEIYRIIREVAGRGTAVIMVSSELEELQGLCHRAVLLVEGREVGTLAGDALTAEAMLAALFERRPDEEARS